MGAINIKLILEKLKNRDEKTFSSLYEHYWEKLFISAYNVLKDESLAKDVVQDVFISFWNRIEDIEFTNLEAYLYQATKKAVFKMIRDHKKFESYHGQLEELIQSEVSIKELEYVELQEIIEKKVNQLPDRCSTIFKLSRFEGKTNKVISKELGITISTVENQINKALKLIREDLEVNYPLIPILLFLIF